MADEPDIPEALGKKLGPLPVGVWALAIGGGLAFAWWMRRQQAGADTEADAAAEPGRSTDTAPGIGGSAGGGGGGGTGGSGGTSSSTRPASNEEWYTQASTALLDTRQYNELSIDTALKTYLSGERQLTGAEAAIVSHAIRLVGAPPVPTPSPPSGGGGTTQPDTSTPPPVDPSLPTTPPPVSQTPTKPADPRPAFPVARSGDKWYTVKSGDNLYEVAEKHYGKPPKKDPNYTKNKRNMLYQVNTAEIEWQARHHGKATSNGGQLLYVGTKLLIPKK